jgi:phenylacetate-coenzyme A ligase PaaK-like adenylate-forming protein
MSGMRLFYYPKLYALERTAPLFVRAMVGNLRYQVAHCPDYAELLASRDFDAEAISAIKTVDDLRRIPPIPTVYLKRRTLRSMTERRLRLRATTSGTSGRTSQIGLDWGSAARGAGMILTTFLTHHLASPRWTNYIVLGYQPAKRNHLGAVRTAYATTFAAPARHREYALRDTGTDYELNLDGLLQALTKYETEHRPVRLIGFPAYFMFLLEELQRAGIKLRLHTKSMVLLAGGWKQFFTERLDKPELYALAQAVLGIGDARIREFFGAVEHPICYFDCPNHHFHVPIYSRLIIRDVNTLEPVGYGQPGLVNLLTPMVRSMPFLSVMTDDLAILSEPGSCGCGIGSPHFDVLGRVGLDDIKTCAASAAELLSGLGGAAP